MNIYRIVHGGRGPLFLKGFLSMTPKTEFTREVVMHFYIKIKNELRNANSQSSQRANYKLGSNISI